VELGGLNGSGLATLVVDARPFKGETKVYVGDTRGGHITVFDPDRSVWYMVALRIQNRGRAVIQDYYGPEVDPDVPAECIAIFKRQSSVYLTSRRSHDLYTASFKDLRNLTSYITPSIKVTCSPNYITLVRLATEWNTDRRKGNRDIQKHGI